MRNLIDGQNLILFFTKNNNVFGAPEESRLVFAKLKEPDTDMPDAWGDEANFAAFDLMKALLGDKVQNLFGKKDLGDIKVIDPEQAEKLLMKNKQPTMKPTDNLRVIHGKHGADMLKLKDKS